jgi:hypothetical protein
MLKTTEKYVRQKWQNTFLATLRSRIISQASSEGEEEHCHF